jgi:hypothetical protein
LFDCPDAVADPTKAAKLKQINALVAQKPTMPMPPGFYASQEQRQIKTFEIPAKLRKVMGEAKCCAIEVLDDILFTKLGIHLIEGQTEVKEVAVAKL